MKHGTNHAFSLALCNQSNRMTHPGAEKEVNGMSLVRLRDRWDVSPWTAISELENQFNQMMNRFGGEFGLAPGKWMPAIDLRETPSEYILEADVPGLTREDIHLEVIDNVVTIRGERKSEQERKGNGYHRVERQYGGFARSIEIPGGFNYDQAAAKFENGVLTVTLPKREEAKPKQIEVKS
jgi:HSP20 family protein